MRLPFKPLCTFLVALALLTYSSCRKTDQSPEQQKETSKNSVIEDRFFNSNRTNDPTEKALVDFIKRKNDKEKFVEKTITQIGYPRWDKTVATSLKGKIMGRGNSDSSLATYYVPFVRDSQSYVNASMIIKTYPSDTTFSYKCDWQYSQTQNNTNSVSDSAEYYAVFFMVLDKAVFGHSVFEIKDTMLFRGNNRKAVKIQLDSSFNFGRNSLFDPITVCQNVTVWWQSCPWLQDGKPCKSPTECDNCNACTITVEIRYCWTEWIETGGGGTGGTGGTSGGGAGTSSPPPCPTGTLTPENVTNPCGPGWTPTGGTGTGGLPPTPEPIDSLLAKSARAINRISDSLFNLSLASGNEWGYVIVRRGDSIYPVNIRTDNNPDQVVTRRFLNLQSGEIAIGDGHTHPDPDSSGRSAPSGNDVESLRGYKNQEHYFHFIEIGHIRYALVVENTSLAQSFFNNISDKYYLHLTHWNLAGSHPSANTNWRNATESTLIQLIGSSSVSGIGIYKSNNLTKTKFIRLNN